LDIIYLDNSATTKAHPDVINEMRDIMENNYGNPSSLHSMGVNAERAVEKARVCVATPLKATPDEIYFTSGGTEGNNLALIGSYSAMRVKGGIITTKAEHKSVLEALKNFNNISYIDIDGKGAIDLESLKKQITDDTSLVSISHVNNETGAIAPIDKIGAIIKNKNPKCLFHVDAVQSYCKIDFPKAAADLITVSGHKIHGPKGIGALYIKKGVRITPLLYGGGQERGLRSGTENTAAIAGFGVAASLKFDLEYIQKLNSALRRKLQNVVINSIDGSPYILNISAPGIRSEILLHALAQRGVMVSSGSACSVNRPEPSHVLTAMGLPRELIDSSVRISISIANTVAEVSAAADIINETILLLKSQLRRY